MIQGWMAASTQWRLDDRCPFEDCGYRRVPVSWRGSPELDEVGRMPGREVDVAPYKHASMGEPVIKYFGVFDQTVGGYCICYFAADPPYWQPPSDVPPQTLFILFDLEILLGINWSLMNNGAVSETEIPKGGRLGSLNCRSLIAGCRGIIVNGVITPRAGSAAKRAPKLMEAAE